MSAREIITLAYESPYSADKLFTTWLFYDKQTTPERGILELTTQRESLTTPNGSQCTVHNNKWRQPFVSTIWTNNWQGPFLPTFKKHRQSKVD